jgi:hypothetical protein
MNGIFVAMTVMNWTSASRAIEEAEPGGGGTETRQ